MSTDGGPSVARPTERGAIRTVALPTEHGGWSLTLEPALLGLLIAPTWAGGALAAAALVAFVARTPLKYVLVDRWRHRRLPRTVLAEKVAAIELGVFAILVAVAASTARDSFWVPLACALPLVVIGFWFDMRSRSRRLLPELSGTIGIGSVVAAIVLAGAQGTAVAFALWGVVAARAIASIPFVRLQLQRFKHQPVRLAGSDIAQALAVAVAALAVLIDRRLLGGLLAILALAAFQLIAARRTPPAATILGVVQLALGLLVVFVIALGVAL